MSKVVSLDPAVAIASFGTPERPAPALDRALDATERCLARHGVRRTTMSDIAEEMGVSRPTLYKQLASVEEAIALVGARQLYLFLDELEVLLAEGASPATFVDMAVHAVTFVRIHPVTERLLTHEPDLIGRIITGGQLSRYVEEITELVAPMLQAGMEKKTIRAGDPRLTAELIIRLCGSLMLAPTAGDLGDLVRTALMPLLDPAPTRKRSPAAR